MRKTPALDRQKGRYSAEIRLRIRVALLVIMLLIFFFDWLQ